VMFQRAASLNDRLDTTGGLASLMLHGPHPQLDLPAHPAAARSEVEVLHIQARADVEGLPRPENQDRADRRRARAEGRGAPAHAFGRAGDRGGPEAARAAQAPAAPGTK